MWRATDRYRLARFLNSKRSNGGVGSSNILLALPHFVCISCHRPTETYHPEPPILFIDMRPFVTRFAHAYIIADITRASPAVPCPIPWAQAHTSHHITLCRGPGLTGMAPFASQSFQALWGKAEPPSLRRGGCHSPAYSTALQSRRRARREGVRPKPSQTSQTSRFKS
jgi:hypothetical protein